MYMKGNMGNNTQKSMLPVLLKLPVYHPILPSTAGISSYFKGFVTKGNLESLKYLLPEMNGD